MAALGQTEQLPSQGVTAARLWRPCWIGQGGGGWGGVKPVVPDVCGALRRVAACICAGVVEENVFSRTAGAILTRSTQWCIEAFMAR